MWPLSGLLLFWLAATTAGLPLRDSPEDISRFELDGGIGGPRERSEAVLGLYLHDQPVTTGPKVALGHLHSGLHKRDTFLNGLSSLSRAAYNQVRNSIWSEKSRERCLGRKMDELESMTSSKTPTAATLKEWLHICSTWKTAHADKKEPSIGQSHTKEELEELARSQPDSANPEVDELIDVMGQLPSGSDLRRELESYLPEHVQEFYYLKYPSQRFLRYTEEGKFPTRFDSTKISSDWLKQYSKYFGHGETTGVTPTGSRPVMGRGRFVKPR